MTVRRFSLLTACETKTRSPQTMGEEFPRPGKSTRQRTFSLVPHLSGKSFSVETPVPSGPRQPGQLLAVAASGLKMTSRAAKLRAKAVFIVAATVRSQEADVKGWTSASISFPARDLTVAATRDGYRANEVFMAFGGFSGGQFASWSSGRAAPGVAFRSSRMMTLSRIRSFALPA